MDGFIIVFMQYEENYTFLISLQKLDIKIDAVKDRLANLPGEIEELKNRIESLKKELESLDNLLKDKELKLREKNSEYREKQEKLALYKKQLLDIKNNDEYRAMLHQIENQKKIIEKVEEEIILMEEELEEFRESLPERKKAIETEIQAVESEKDKLLGMDSVLKKDISVLLEERHKIEERIKVSVLKKYERLRAKGYREVLVPIKKIMGNEGEEYVCSACNSTIPLEISLKVREGESFVRCENCGRYLYYEFENEEVK